VEGARALVGEAEEGRPADPDGRGREGGPGAGDHPLAPAGRTPPQADPPGRPAAVLHRRGGRGDRPLLPAL